METSPLDLLASHPPPLPPRRRRGSLGLLVLVGVGALVLGGAIGFPLGIYWGKPGRSLLSPQAQVKGRPEIVGPVALDRDAFSVQVPSNWRVETEDEDYDPDTNFALISLGRTRWRFYLSPNDPNQAVADQVAGQKKIMKDARVDSFGHYGRYQGIGAIIRGKVDDVPLTVRAFAVDHWGSTVTVVQICADMYDRRTRSGFELIENSFVLKDDPVHPAASQTSE